MKPQNIFSFFVLLSLGAFALWWFTRPATETPLPAKVTNTQAAPAPKPAQVEAPKAAPVPASASESLLEASAPQEPPASAPATTVINASPVVTTDAKGVTSIDFGEFEVTNDVPMEWVLDNGEVCRLTPKVVDDHTVAMQFKMTQETGEGQTAMEANIVVIPGQAVTLGIGKLRLSLTAVLKAN